jgi:hypothetical protein
LTDAGERTMIFPETDVRRDRAIASGTVQFERRTPAPSPMARRHAGRSGGAADRNRPPLPRSGSAHNLVELQRLAGNGAVLRMLQPAGSGNLATTPGRGVPLPERPVVQTRRIAKPADTFWLRKYDQRLGVEGEKGSPERMDRIWHALEGLYDTYASKGEVLWAGLQAQQRRYQQDPAGLANSMQDIRAQYDRIYRRHYLTAIRQTGKRSVPKVETSGYVEERPDAPDPMVYWSEIDVDKKVINVIRAYATKDLARIHDAEGAKPDEPYEKIGLQHSEILWQQLVETAREHFSGREKRGQELLKNVAGITVHQASNVITQQVVFMAYPDGSFWDTHDHEWTAGSEEFKAILATPNASMAAHLLRDHIDQVGGRSISSITARGGKDHYLDIKFTEPAVSYERALLLAIFMAVLLGLIYLR